MVKLSNCRVGYKVKSKSSPLSLYAVTLSHLSISQRGVQAHRVVLRCSLKCEKWP